jgi:Domain of unknown function (DUF4157)
MGVPAFLRLSDSGVQLDSGLRRVLEGAFCVDLSGVRLHAGPRTAAFLQVHGCPAAAAGHRVFMPAARRGDGERWLRVLIHEITHVIQQAQGVTQAGGWWERQAAEAAAVVTAGRVYPDLGLRPPRTGHGAAVLAGFNLWEHRLLGDVPGEVLVSIAAQTQNWQSFVRQQIKLMGLWQDGGSGVGADAIHEIDPGVTVVTLPGSGCLATSGELNAVADFVANVDAVNTMPASFMFPFLQQIRQESYNRLSSLLGNGPDVSFAGAITGYLGGERGDAALETRLIENFSRPLGVNHYLGLLARNACHFVPFAWHRWRQAHTAARDLALRAWQEHSGSLADAAWIAEGYAGHFLQDSFAAGHLPNKTRVMQWFAAWVSGSDLITVTDWEDVRQVTAVNQPLLTGDRLYDIRYPGLSNDPQTAEEHAHMAQRMAATGVQAYGAVSRERAYRQYLAFFAAYPVQLSSKHVHDHFNASGLDVASEVAAFRAYGDEHMLKNGADVSIVAQAAAASRKAISDLITQGRSKARPEEILRNVPAGITDRSGRVIPLLDWHQGGALKTEAETLFASTRATIAGVARSTMGIVSADSEPA